VEQASSVDRPAADAGKNCRVRQKRDEVDDHDLNQIIEFIDLFSGTQIARTRSRDRPQRRALPLRSGDKVMGIFGALSTAVAGMRAQSFALENISGNIANSQTTAFKRTDTSFQDLIAENIPSQQVAGSVIANSRGTITVQGDIQSASIGTFMAINGDGFFVVQKPTAFNDGRPTFTGVDLYTRRGDYQLDQNGYLVNGAGYFLSRNPIDTTTGNTVGSVPQLLQFQNGFLPAVQTTQIDYRVNLASYPLTADHDTTIAGSELLNPANFRANPINGAPAAARIIGSGAKLLPDAAAVYTGTADLSALNASAGTLRINGVDITINAGDDANDVVNDINTAVGVNVTASLDGNKLVLTSSDAKTKIEIENTSTLATLNELGLAVGTTNPTNLLTQGAVGANTHMTIKIGSSGTLNLHFDVGDIETLGDLSTQLGALAGGTASVDPLTGNLTITAATSGPNDIITVGGDVDAGNFGVRTLTGIPAKGGVIANDVTAFLNESVGGGAVTVYDVSGAAANVQFRWAKIDSESLGVGHKDTWNLFYQSNSTATGDNVAWTNAGVDYNFAPDGSMDPPILGLTLSDVTVDGVQLGDLKLSHGSGGVTQYADPNGTAQVGTLQQDGFAAGQLQGVTVSDNGRVVGTYSNGRTLDLAEITLANFSGANNLKMVDGGAFEATAGSGPAIYNASGKIVGSSLEGSNTDIADEFTKLIVTQQAYSANTRVVTTSNTMVQDLLNMLR
jgi:flagellar hook protein FlgE